MRPLEWVVLLSFVPCIVAMVLSDSRQGKALLVSAFLRLVASVIQIGVSGWRAQMIPLYLLALLVGASRVPPMLGRSGPAYRQRQIVGSVMLAAAVLAGGIGAGWVLPVISLPQPTGPYAVGIVDRELVDEARDRRLMASIWYPAGEAGPAAPLTHYLDDVMAGLGKFTDLPDLVFQHLRFISLAASEDVPALQRPEPFPVLVFSHGLNGMRLQSSSTMQELAGWGHVVVAIDHTGAAAVTVFPDGEARFYDATTFGIPSGEDGRADLIEQRMFPV
jgi:predicted dienelactone hydrolase